MAEILKNFSQKHITDQLSILNSIETTRQKETIPELLELLANKKCEQATHEMIYHTLFSLMSDDEKSIRSGILHPSFRVKLLSIRRCRKSKISNATPELLQTLNTSDDMEVIGEIIMTLGSFRDPEILPTLRPYLFHSDPSVVSWTMESLSAMGNEQFENLLHELIESDETLAEHDKECSIATILAVEHLGKLDSEGSRQLLQSFSGHPHPVFRKAVNEALHLL